MTDRVDVTDNPGEGRYDVTLDGKLAGSTFYHDHNGIRSFTHTEINPAYEGHGLGSQLIRAALDDTRTRALAVLPFCPFVRAFIEKHPDYVDLVPEPQRARFQLADETSSG